MNLVNVTIHSSCHGNYLNVTEFNVSFRAVKNKQFQNQNHAEERDFDFQRIFYVKKMLVVGILKKYLVFYSV